MKRLIILIASGFFLLISDSYSQMFGGSIFKNKDKIDLEKFINLDITKYKPTDIKKIIGQDFETKEWTDDKKVKVTNYLILLKHDENEYELTLSEKNNNLFMEVGLILLSLSIRAD
jgi:hypothetical protein